MRTGVAVEKVGALVDMCNSVECPTFRIKWSQHEIPSKTNMGTANYVDRLMKACVALALMGTSMSCTHTHIHTHSSSLYCQDTCICKNVHTSAAFARTYTQIHIQYALKQVCMLVCFVCKHLHVVTCNIMASTYTHTHTYTYTHVHLPSLRCASDAPSCGVLGCSRTKD